MDREELYARLDVESPEDFQYFENLSALLECEEDIDFEEIAELLSPVDKDMLAGLIDDYFEEITGFIPGAETELYSIFENLRKSLVGMSRNVTDESVEMKLVEEIERFRRWYSMDSVVYAAPLSGEAEKEITLRDALVLVRIENIGGEKYRYDFTECLDYPIEEYVMSFSDMITLSEEIEDEADEMQNEIERNVLSML